MKQIFLQTENVRKFWNTLKDVTDTENGQSGIALIYGESGTGMTMCAKNYAAETGAALLRTMQDWTPYRMFSALCSEIIGSQPPSLGKARSAITDALSKTPRAILIDEADRLRGLGMVEHLIEMHDQTGTPIILMSDLSLYNKISSNIKIRNRITHTLQLKPIGIEDAQKFLEQSTDLQIDPSVAQLIHSQIGESIWNLLKIVPKLEQRAKASETDIVTAEIAQKTIDSDLYRSCGLAS